LRLAALVESTEHVCCRYRLSAFRPDLAAAGHSLELSPVSRGFLARWRIGSNARDADAVILQRKLLSTIELGLLRRRVKRLLFDFDDAIWLRDSYSSKGHESSRRRRRFQATLRRCDAAVAGNEFLAEHAQRWSPNCRVIVVPTCVDVSRYVAGKHDRASGEAELVWIGSSSTLRGLEAIQPILERIGETNPRVRLKLICDRFLNLHHLPVIASLWSEATEAAELAGADIGISWIPDDPWSRGKCGLKMLQFMAAGLPVVANPVGVQCSMVRHNETGFLASTEDEWVEAVRLLAADPDLRRRMGAAGRRIVEERFSVPAGIQLWLALLRQISGDSA
jgi:glycosyltransferase involved in cell wall biosynthesis